MGQKPKETDPLMGNLNTLAKSLILGAVAILAFIVFIFCIETVPSGHEYAATLFGQAQDRPLREGFHFVDPRLNFVDFDMREQEITFTGVSLPTSDQMTSHGDITIKYRHVAGATPDSVRNFGDLDRIVQVTLIPAARTAFRKAPRSLNKAEELFDAEKVALIQLDMLESLSTAMARSNVTVSEVLIRSIELPGVITTAIEAKKKMEQEAEKQKAELDRFTTEQQQIVATAEAELDSQKLVAEGVKVAADATAYKIRVEATAKADGIKTVRAQLRGESYIALVQAETWNGAPPQFQMTGGAGSVPMIYNLPSLADLGASNGNRSATVVPYTESFAKN